MQTDRVDHNDAVAGADDTMAVDPTASDIRSTLGPRSPFQFSSPNGGGGLSLLAQLAAQASMLNSTVPHILAPTPLRAELPRPATSLSSPGTSIPLASSRTQHATFSLLLENTEGTLGPPIRPSMIALYCSTDPHIEYIMQRVCQYFADNHPDQTTERLLALDPAVDWEKAGRTVLENFNDVPVVHCGHIMFCLVQSYVDAAFSLICSLTRQQAQVLDPPMGTTLDRSSQTRQ